MLPSKTAAYNVNLTQRIIMAAEAIIFIWLSKNNLKYVLLALEL